MADTKLYWFNYRTQEHEYITTPEDFTDYIPQQEAALGLYRLYLTMGDTHIDAAGKVLKACVKD